MLTLGAADPVRCKSAFITEATCDPDKSGLQHFWDWATGNGMSLGVNCLPQQDKYFACLAAGMPHAPAPAPPPLPTAPGGWNDPTLPQQADDATRDRYADFWSTTFPGYFQGQATPDDGGLLPGGLPTWLLVGGLALAAAFVFTGRR